MTTVPQPDTSFSTDTFAEALSPENAGSALTASTQEVTGGAAVQAEVQAAQAAQAAPLRAAQEVDATAFGDKLKAAWEETGTAYLLDALAPDPDYEYDPNFDPNRVYTDMVRSYGLQNDETTQRTLGAAESIGEMRDIAERMQRHQQNEEILSRNGALAITAGIVDPVYLITDAATFGATRALRLGRAASAALGAAGSVGAMGAVDAAGRDTTGFEYVLGAALTGGMYSLFPGSTANRIARGEPTEWGTQSQPNAQGATSSATFNRAKESFNGVRKTVNEFTTEYDKLAQNPEAESIISRIADDPVRRGDFNGENAASYMRMYRNEVDGLHQNYTGVVDKIMAKRGRNWMQRRLDLSGETGQAREAFEKEVAQEMLKRNDWWRRNGTEPPRSQDADIAEAVDAYERLMTRTAEIARDAGSPDFADFTPSPGYFHRSWKWDKIAGMADRDKAVGSDFTRRMLQQSALNGLRDTTQEEAAAIADAIIQRAQARMRDESLSFMGSLGKGTNATMREMLEAANVSPERVASIMNKFEQQTTEKAKIKYGKSRLDLDMNISMRGPDGEQVSMSDLIDTDLSRLGENYSQQMTGRAALQRVGIGGGDNDITAARTAYAQSLRGLDDARREDLLKQFDGLMSDFTGIRPQANILSPTAQRFASLAGSTMLGASGLWQVLEFSTMAYRYGAAQTTTEMFRRFPGIKKVLKDAGKNPDLADEISNTLNLDLSRDVVFRPWLRQHDVNLNSSNTALDRVLHAGKQATPYLNGMKYIQNWQSRINMNLAINQVAKAARGDAEALRVVEQYGLKGEQWEAVKAAAGQYTRYSDRGNALEMNWGAWSVRDREAAANTILRIADDTVLYGRAGQGSSFARSAVGQLFGQFRSFVAFAHNKTLRGTLRNGGIGGMAMLLAFQYPTTLMAVYLNEARKGNTVDLDDETAVRELLTSALGYTSGLGFAADVAGIAGLTGGSRGGLSTPVTGIFDAAPKFTGGLGALAQGEATKGAKGIAEAASAVAPGVGLMPATTILLNALQED